MARLVDMENDLKDSINQYGVKDPIIYNKIYDLCFEFLRRNHKMNNIPETEETATILAETLYLKIYKGGTIGSWIGYINIAYIAAIRKYRKMTSSEIWDITNDSKLEEAIIQTSASGSISLSEINYSHIFNRDCIDKIYDSIEEILDNSCRYYRYTSKWNNLYLFILASLSAGYPVFVFIEQEDEQYARMMLSIVKNKLFKEFKVSFNDTQLSGKDLVYLFTMGEIFND